MALGAKQPVLRTRVLAQAPTLPDPSPARPQTCYDYSFG